MPGAVLGLSLLMIYFHPPSRSMGTLGDRDGPFGLKVLKSSQAFYKVIKMRKFWTEFDMFIILG